MAQLVLGAAGAAIGAYFGGPTGAQVGWAIGSAVGGAYEASKKRIEGPRLNDLRITGTEYGDPIPWIMGGPRIAGQIWWSSDKREVSTTQRAGKGSGPKVTSYTYECDLLIGLTDCEIEAVTRVWSNGTLVWNIRADADVDTFFSSFDEGPWTRMTVYTGGAAQEPDPTYEAAVGAANAPAYRGRGTVFIEGLQLDGSGQLPNLTFEVCTAATGEVRADEFNTLSSASNPEWGALTLDATGATVFRAIYGSYYTVNVERYNYDGTVETLNTFQHQSGGFATITGSAAKMESDTPCILWSYAGSSTTLQMYDASGGLVLNLTMPEAMIGERVRAAYRNGVLVVGQTDTTSKRIYKYESPSITQSAVMADWVQAVCICTDAIYALKKSGGSIYQLNLATLALDDTIATPEAATQASIVVGGWNGKLHYGSSNGIWRRDGSAWTQIVGALSPGVVNNQTTFSDLIAFTGNVWVNTNVGSSGSYTMRRIQIAMTPDTETLQATVEALCERAGLAAAQFDASDLASITRPVRALAIAQVEGVRGALEQLRTGYGFDLSLSDKLYFRPRGDAAVRTLAYEEIGAGPETAIDDPLPIVLAADLEVPPQVAVQYRNASNDYQVGTEYSDRIVSTQTATQTVALALGLTPAEAKGVADTMVTDAWAALASTRFGTTLEHADLEPGDVVQVTDAAGNTLRVRIVRRTDERGVLSFETVRDDASVIDSEETTADDYDQATTIVRYGETTLRFLDIPILRDVDDDAGFYVAGRAASGTSWPGAEAQLSSDGVSYSTVETISESAVLGSCTSTLGTAAAGGAVIDEVNTLTVSMGAGELASSTRDAMMADETINVMQVGSEIIRFIAATQTGSNPNTYRLARLWRGQLGTESHVATHAASESCCLLRMQGLRRVTRPTSELDQLRYLRAVTLGRSATDAVVEQVTNTGIGLKPWAPVNLRAGATATGYTVTWDRRTRLKTRFASSAGINVPLGEAAEAYEVDLLTSGDVLVSTTAVTEPEIDLTAANLVGTLPTGVARDHLAGGVHYGVDIEGNTNSTLRRLVAQTTAGVSQTSPYLGAVLVDACYTATDAYTAAMYLTATVPSAYSSTYVQRFDLADITAAAATYTAGTAGDVVGLTHDGTDLWILEQFALRLRQLDDSALTASASHALTGPVEFGLANDGTRLFFCDQGDAVGWTIATTTEAWRTALPAGYIMVVGIVAAGGNVFIATRAGICVYDAAAGTLVDTVDLQVYAPPGTYCAGLAVHGSDVVCCLPDGTVVVLDGATAAEVARFASNGYALAGSDGTTIWVAGQSSPSVVGVDQTTGYDVIGGSLAGYKARVYQISATVGRGYPATLTL